MAIQSIKESMRITLMRIIDKAWNFIESEPYYADFYSDFFSKKNVMVIVPHQDDEINLLGGVLEQYVNCGSSVSVVFATNGDYLNIAETRINEAMRVLTNIGIKEDNIIFFGFGDGWKNDKKRDSKGDIYNAKKPNDIWNSHVGHNKTYGTKHKSCYRDLSYTKNNFLSCFIDIILEKKPDVIFCSDYDAVPSHRCVSLLFDDAMGILLKQHHSYRPVVYKGFCYSTAWTSVPDFYSSYNIQSTVNPSKTDLVLTGHYYSWNNRVRLPVYGKALSRRLEKCGTYKSLYNYRSQYAFKKSKNIINGDKVFWERRTDNLLFSSDVFYKNNRIYMLNDFKLVESDDVETSGLSTFGTVALDDRIDIIFHNSHNISRILLYRTNICNSKIIHGEVLINNEQRIIFSDHDLVNDTLFIRTDLKDVKNISIILKEYLGEIPRISQIEAFDNLKESVNYIYPIDKDGNFAYDYWIIGKHPQTFGIYRYPKEAPIDYTRLKVTQKYKNTISPIDVNENGNFKISCKKNKTLIINMSYYDCNVSFKVTNPSIIKRLIHKWLSRLCDKSFLYNSQLAFAGYEYGNYNSLIRGSQKYD